MQTNFVKE